MDRLLGYGLTGTIGLAGTTIAAAIVGNPIPVVVPAVAAGGAIAAHHIHQSRDADAVEQTDDTDLFPPEEA